MRYRPDRLPGARAGAAHAGFLVHGEQHFQGRMRQLRRFQGRQGQGHADAVVRAQGGVVRHQPAVPEHGPDRIAMEVVIGAGVLLADHVQMALQHDAGPVGAARAGGLPQDQVAGGVHPGLDPAGLGPGPQVVAQGRLMLGGARDGAQGGEMVPDGAGFQMGEDGGGHVRRRVFSRTRLSPGRSRPITNPGI
jgi:hypothetical protein